MTVTAIPTDLPEVLLLRSAVFEDERGTLYESYNRRAFEAATGLDVVFVQENRSRSRRNVLRGLHYQLAPPQGKLVQTLHGEIFDVAVDLRRSSPTFGRWAGVRLGAEDPCSLWVPGGFAHGYLALTDEVEVLYKLTAFRDPGSERTLAWNDKDVGIVWPSEAQPILSARDAAGAELSSAETFR